MDLNAMLRRMLPGNMANSTSSARFSAPTGSEIPDGFVDLLPLIGGPGNPLFRAILFAIHSVGLTDLSLVVWVVGIFLVWRSLSQFWNRAVMAFIRQHFMSSVAIDGQDEIFMYFMKWLAQQPTTANSRKLSAETRGKFVWEDEEDDDAKLVDVLQNGPGSWLNFSNHESRSPPRYLPDHGQHSFWYKGRYFSLNRAKETVIDGGNLSGPLRDKERIVISTYGWAPDPIKDLIQHCKTEYFRGHHRRTTIKRPNGNTMRRYGSKHSWVVVANRPVRPMETVVLDEVQKRRLLADVNEYLHPATPRWYANRGIPLRRGYLFHGPPGTGKTSLSFALAGVFGLDIYVISLLDPSLTEEELSGLFNGLPRRCIVLLEDIDTAGLKRPPQDADEIEPENMPNDEPKNLRTITSKDKDQLGKEAGEPFTPPKFGDDAGKKDTKDLIQGLTKALRKSKKDDDENRKGISLSGLLNAIDGVASQEGRVLIMTTNKPESLDDALIRPGRVDLQVIFRNASQAQAKELFLRMYVAESPQASPHAAAAKSDSQSLLSKAISRLSSTMASAKSLARDIPVINGTAQGSLESSKKSEALSKGLNPSQAQADGDMAVSVGSMSQDYIQSIADQFAGKIPDQLFTPAEIQGFLLMRKKEPARALDEVDDWVNGLTAQKATKTKVALVQ